MLKNFFNPKSIAVIGASRTPGKIGYNILHNLIQYDYPGVVYPVNPEAPEILGVKAYPSILDIPGEIGLAVVVVPPPRVGEVISQCGAKKIDSAIIITAGFGESGSEGTKLEDDLLRRAKESGMRVIGPNCLGVIDTHSKVNASFAAGMPAQGSIGFFSQSGALCIAVLDRALAEDIGFSKFISMGNKADISDTDIMLALAEDDNTKVILGYIEGVKDGKKFMETASQVSKKKPLIILKSGITSSGARAASSHTGALSGREAAFDAAFKQSGVIRAHSVAELFNYALAFADQPLPQGPNIVIITNSGGPGILAADASDQSDLQLISLHKEIVDKLRTFLPSFASFYNPVDILGDAGAERYEKALTTVLQDEKVNGVIVLLTPTAIVDVEATAKVIANISNSIDKPILASFMGKKRVEPGAKILMKSHVPNYSYPEEAVSSLSAMYNYQLWINRPDKTYARVDDLNEKVSYIFEKVKEEKRERLSDSEVYEVLNTYGFSQPKSLLARTSEEAVAAAKGIGYPVAMKIISPQVIHKSDVGGIRLNLNSKKEVADAFFNITTRVKDIMPAATIYGVMVEEMVLGGKEVIIGITKDAQFGHMIMFGLGGIYVEVLKDISFRIAPLSHEDAIEMIREIKTFPLLRGVRGEAEADIPAIKKSLLILSQMTLDFPQIIEADINPLLVKKRGEGVIAIDARFTVGGE
ncbi:MAG: acetate--CoA ligase family protein [Nitrospirota bacterium]|nr:acetate--CoA ligase family protein [Nitrospirota bacterium]MDH5767907.1 acetate--CoA ligase family protein [Nitrospirota bacterium]